MQIQDILKKIDCSEHEIKTFLALLNVANGVSVLRLSKILNIPRATIYGHLSSLIKLGLIKKSIENGRSLYYAENLNSISSIYDEKIQQIKLAKSELIKKISEQKIINNHEPKFIIYETPNATELIFRDILRARIKQTFWFWPIKKMADKIKEETFTIFHEERLRRGIELNILCPEKDVVKIDNHPFLNITKEGKTLKKIRVLRGNIGQLTGYGVYGTRVAFVSSDQENFSFIVDSKELSQTMMSQFKYLWDMGIDFNKYFK